MYNRQCSGNIYMNLEPSVHHVKQIKRRDIPPPLSKNEEENGGGSGSRVVTIGSMTHFENSLLFFFEVESLFFSLLLLQGV